MDEEIKKLLEQNLARNLEIYETMQKVKTYLFWAQIFSVFRVLIIVVPLILAIIFLPPFISQFLDNYTQVLGGAAGNLKLPL